MVSSKKIHVEFKWHKVFWEIPMNDGYFKFHYSTDIKDQNPHDSMSLRNVVIPPELLF